MQRRRPSRPELMPTRLLVRTKDSCSLSYVFFSHKDPEVGMHTILQYQSLFERNSRDVTKGVVTDSYEPYLGFDWN